MIEAKELSQVPIRQGNANACLLASYATALYPFTNIPEIQYFIDCCNLLCIQLISQGDAISLLQPQLLDPKIGTTKKGLGYDWIEELYSNCNGDSFIRAREITKLLRLSRSETESQLQNSRSTSIFSLHFPNHAAHSICIIKDPQLEYIARDSGQLLRNPDPTIDSAGSTLEELIYRLYNVTGIQIGESILIIEK